MGQEESKAEGTIAWVLNELAESLATAFQWIVVGMFAGIVCWVIIQ